MSLAPIRKDAGMANAVCFEPSSGVSQDPLL
jgi:hypothetical protein